MDENHDASVAAQPELDREDLSVDDQQQRDSSRAHPGAALPKLTSIDPAYGTVEAEGTNVRLGVRVTGSVAASEALAADHGLALEGALDREAFLRARIDVLELRLKRATAVLDDARREADALKQQSRDEANARRTMARNETDKVLAETVREFRDGQLRAEDRLAATLRWTRLLGRSTTHLAERVQRASRSARTKSESDDAAAAHPIDTGAAPDQGPRRGRSPPAKDSALEAHMRLIASSKLFHADYYLAHYPGNLPQGTNPLRHYVTRGWREGANPNPLFDVRFYLLRDPDLQRDGIEPLRHYIERGSAALRDPHPAFLTRFYASRCPSEKPAETTWLRQFLRLDIPAISPHPLFDPEAYARRASLTENHAAVALLHYLLAGWKQGLPFALLFDADHYRAQHPEGAVATEPYAHYVTFGAAQGLSPHPLFDPPTYLRARKVDPRTLDPLVDYILTGESEGAAPNPLFDPVYYRSRFMPAEAGLTALEHYLQVGSEAGHDPHPDFDTEAYLRLRHGLPAPAKSVLEDFFQIGLFELPWSDVAGSAGTGSGRVLPPAIPARPPLPTDAAAVPTRHYPGKVAARAGVPTVLVVAHAAGEHLFGSERSFLDMLDGLAHLPANIAVALPRNVPTYTNAIRAMCQDVFVFDYRWWRKGEDSSPLVRAAFRKIIAESKVDAVHVNTIMLREALQAARDCGVPGVVHVRELIAEDAALQDLIGLTPDDIIDETKRRSDWIIGNSRTTATAFHKAERTFVVPNVVDTDAMDMAPTADRDTVRFGLISSNIPKKGLLDAVKLAQLAVETAPEARFLIIGPETDLVRDLRHQQGRGDVPNNLVFVGYAATPADAIRQVDVVLSLSHFAESFGRTVLEAMAARRPVIGYEWGAIPELIEHGRTGYLVPFRKPELALPAVQELCRDPEMLARMGERGRAAAVARFGLASYRAAFARAYAEILPLDRFLSGRPPGPLIRPARYPGLKTVEPALKLAYFCWHFPVPSETFVLSELEYLVRSGVDVIVFCRQSPHKTFKPGFAIAVERVDSAGRLAQRLRETGRTMVHAHFTYPTVTDMVWPACEQAEVPFTFMAHAQDIFRHENDRKNRLAEIGASRWCRKMFTLSRFHYDYVAERGFPRDKILINPNAVDTARFEAAAVPDRELRRSRRIIAIHRFVEKKGLDLLIRAAALLADCDVRIDIYGYGESEAAYRQLATELGLTNVAIHGPLTHDEVIETMRHADLFACSSVRATDGDMDGIPTSVVESMAAGLPVLTTDIAGLPELVVDGITGIVAAPTPDAVAASIRRYYALPVLKVRTMIATARKQACSRHDVRRTARIQERVWCNRTVDVVVVAWNNLAELQAVVGCALAKTALPFHLIICDNQSTREPVGAYLDTVWRDHDRVTVVHNDRNTMVGPGTNLAIAQGSSDYVVYLCAKEGISFRHGWDTAFVHAFEQQPEVGLVGSIGFSPTYLRGAQYPTGVKLFERFRNKGFAADHPTRLFGHVQGGLFGVRRRMIEAIGGFSEDVPHDYTDVEYSYYAESCGWKLGEAPGVLSLFNKSRPTLSQRFDETVMVAHPVLLEQIANFQTVVDGLSRHCNVCDWFGSSFEPASLACPHCASSPEDRSIQRWLSDGTLMYRRLPALCAGLASRMEQAWSTQFQGPRVTISGLLDDLRSRGRLPNRPGTFALSMVRFEALSPEELNLIAGELRRLLSADGSALFQIVGQDGPEWEAQREQLLSAMSGHGFRTAGDLTYASRAIEFSHVPMTLFRRADHPE